MSPSVDDTGQQFINGRRRQGRSSDPLTVTNPSNGQVVATGTLASTDDVDDAVAAAKAAFPAGPARRRPSARRRCTGSPASSRPSPGSWPPQKPPGRQAHPAHRGFDVPGTIDNVAFFAGAARNLEGKATAEYSGDHTSIDPPRTDRRHRLDRPVELPPADGGLEDPAGHRRRQHHRAQARRAHPADLPAVRRGRPPRPASRTGSSTSSPAAARTPARHWCATRDVAHGLLHRLDRAWAARSARRRGPGKRVHLELGGKAPFVVFDDADLEAAVHGAVAGSLINAGQDCTAATRAYVQRPLTTRSSTGVAELMAAGRLGARRRPGHRPRAADLVQRTATRSPGWSNAPALPAPRS